MSNPRMVDTPSTKVERGSPASHHGQPAANGNSTSVNGASRQVLTEANLAAHTSGFGQHQDQSVMLQKWLDDRDDQLIRLRIAEFWAELLQHDDLAVAIEAIVQNREAN